MGINKSIEKKGSGHSILLIKDLYGLNLSFVSIFNIETQLYYLVYLSISKAKQFQKQPKKIQESDKNLQEDDKEYLRKQNVDLHSDGVVNKIISKDVGKYLNKCSGDNIDKSIK